jgi:hypothetical protein
MPTCVIPRQPAVTHSPCWRRVARLANIHGPRAVAATEAALDGGSGKPPRPIAFDATGISVEVNALAESDAPYSSMRAPQLGTGAEVAANSDTSAGRRRRGRGRPFIKGQSGNPLGRPKAALDLQLLVREHTEEAVRTLAECLHDPKHKVAAAIALLDRGWGRPVQAISGDRNAPPLAIHFTWADAAIEPGPEPARVGNSCDSVSSFGAADGDDPSEGICVAWSDGEVNAC